MSQGVNLPAVFSDTLNRDEHSVHSSEEFYSFSTLDELVTRKMKILAFFSPPPKLVQDFFCGQFLGGFSWRAAKAVCF